MKLTELKQKYIKETQAEFGLCEALVLCYLRNPDTIMLEVDEQETHSDDIITVTFPDMQDAIKIAIAKKDVLQAMSDIFDCDKIKTILGSKTINYLIEKHRSKSDSSILVRKYLQYANEILFSFLSSLISTFLEYEYPFPEEIALLKKLIQSLSSCIAQESNDESSNDNSCHKLIKELQDRVLPYEIGVMRLSDDDMGNMLDRLQATVDATNDVGELYVLEAVIKKSAIYSNNNDFAEEHGPHFKGYIDEIFKTRKDKDLLPEFGLVNALVLGYVRIYTAINFEVDVQKDHAGIIITVTVHDIQDSSSSDNPYSIEIAIAMKDLLQFMSDIFDCDKIKTILGSKAINNLKIKDRKLLGSDILVRNYLQYANEILFSSLAPLIDTFLKYEYPLHKEIALLKKLIQSLSSCLTLESGDESSSDQCQPDDECSSIGCQSVDESVKVSCHELIAEIDGRVLPYIQGVKGLSDQSKENMVARLVARVEATDDVSTLYVLEEVIKESAIYTDTSGSGFTLFSFRSLRSPFSRSSGDDDSAKRYGPCFKGSIDAMFKVRQHDLLKIREKGLPGDKTNPSVGPST